MKNKWFKVIALIVIFVLVGGLVWLTIQKLNEATPVEDIAAAREMISEARVASADIYSPILFGEAIALYDSANKVWRQENEKFFFARQYARAMQFAKLSIEKATLSRRKAIAYSRDLHTSLTKELQFYHQKCTMFERQFYDFPMDVEVRNSFATAKLSLKEAEMAYSKHDYHTVVEKLRTTREELDFTLTITRRELEEYFTMFGLWSELKEQALDYSVKQRDYALVVSKFEKKCFVYYLGQQVAAYDIELGKNWIGDKRHRGDKTTPEGQYLIMEKKSGKQTKYYKALLINFPNKDDKLRFAEEMKNGTLPKHADIGGLIEIHGEGGKGNNWTDGCIALKNEDMDALYAKAKKGSPLFIVGSLQPLDKLVSW